MRCALSSIFEHVVALRGTVVHFSNRLALSSTSFQKGNMINFAKGHPNTGLLPVQEMQDIFLQVGMSSNVDRLQRSLNYPKSDRGDPELLGELCAFIDRNTHQDELGSIPDDINVSNDNPSTDYFITHGVSHGLELLCSTQTSPGEVVLMERPTYFLAAAIFKSHGLKVQSLPMKSSGGVDLDRLEKLLYDGDLESPRMIYIIPTHQNPTARVMPIRSRWKLAALANRYNILVVADEVYHLLDWRDPSRDGPRPARMAAIDSMISNTSTSTAGRPGCCVTVSSFTKIFAPGVRCGWIEGPKPIIDSLVALGYIQSQGGCAPLVGELLYTSLSQGIGDRVLKKLNATFKERSDMLCRELASEPGIQIHTQPLGGYFVWISFKGIGDTGPFLDYCLEHGVTFLPGKRCDVSDEESEGTGSDCLKFARLCFADLDMAEIERGAVLLRSCYRDFLQTM